MKDSYMIYLDVIVNIYGKEKSEYEIFDISYDDKYNNSSMAGILELACEELENHGPTMDDICESLIEEYGENRLYKVHVGMSFRDTRDFEGEIDTDVIFEYETCGTTFKETETDILSFRGDYYIVLAISPDMKTCSDTTRLIHDKFNMKELLRNHMEEISKVKDGEYDGDAIIEEDIFNLIARTNSENEFEKDSLIAALVICGTAAMEMGIKKLAIAEIPCENGWEEMKKEIRLIFANTQMEILFCKEVN